MSTDRPSREVNNILHTLRYVFTFLVFRLAEIGRGEHFRHLQNLRQSRSHLHVQRNFNTRSFPLHLLNIDNEEDTPKPAEDAVARMCSGPSPPKSWRLTWKSTQDLHDTPDWRRNALRLAATRLENLIQTSAVPSLTLMCLQVLLSKWPDNDQLREEITPYLFPHLRKQVIRSFVVDAPLVRWKLEMLYANDGHADGEVIVIGPRATLRDEEFLRNGLLPPNALTAEGGKVEDWEADDTDTRHLETLVLMSVRLSTSTMLTLPQTLVNLVLVDLPHSLPLHRLPKLCPLLEFLDLSYNAWLKQPSSEVLKNLHRIEWSRWAGLKLLGWRECIVLDNMAEIVNKGRWDDVDIVYS